MGIVSWVIKPLIAICLVLDGIVYSLVGYAYNLFLIMSRINMNEIYVLVEPLVLRVKAVIMVFIMFKMAVSLINILVSPDKLEADGAKFIRNLVIAICILATYQFIFNLGNDISMLLIGNNGTSSSYRVLKSANEKEGIVSRLIFGRNSSKSVDNFGQYLSAITFNTFLYDKEGYSNVEKFFEEAIRKKSDFDFVKVVKFTFDVFSTVEYRFPILSTFVGLILLWTLISILVGTAVRALKLLTLQIIAPIPISSIISDGLGSSSFSSFYKTYISVLLDLALRIGAMLFISALIGVIHNKLMDMAPWYLASGISFWTLGIIFIIFIIGAFKFIEQLPSFIESITGFKMADSSVDSFGNALKTMTTIGKIGAAGVGGAVGGIVGGGLAGISKGSIGYGILHGMKAGASGKLISGMPSLAAESIERKEEMLEHGGRGKYMKHKFRDFFGANARDISEANKKIKQATERNQAIEDAESRAAMSLADTSYYYAGIGQYENVSSESDLFERVMASDTKLANYKAIMEDTGATQSKRNTAVADYSARRETIRKDVNTSYTTAIDAEIAADTFATYDSEGNDKIGNAASRKAERMTNNNIILTNTNKLKNLK